MRPEPPLLLLAAGRRPRARKAPKVRVRELALHYAVVDLLKKIAKPDWIWAHYPSGEARDARTGSKLKKMGTKRGWPDLLMISPEGRFYGLEMKAPDGALTDDQEQFQAWAARHAIPYAVVKTIDEVIAVLTAWGAIRRIGGAA